MQPSTTNEADDAGGALAERLRALESELIAERAARKAAEDDARSRDDFLAMLAHDLRNPLATVLTTARLVVSRQELSPELRRRLERAVACGLRMQRMIEQMVDVTVCREGEHVAIMREPEQDLSRIAAALADDARAAHPARQIDLLVEGDCTAFVDRDRVAQVLRTLLGNALAHGARERPVRIALHGRADTVRVAVHNEGPPIDDGRRALLFDGRRRGRNTAGLSEGLGLGLYIAERIVLAHGGTLEVESSAEAGTVFSVTLPRSKSG